MEFAADGIVWVEEDMSAMRTPPAITPPARSSAPIPFRWNVEQYRELYTTNMFNDLKTMLINGELYVLAMPGPRHDVTLGLTDDWLRRQITSGCFI
jgi:hypothetical protein